MRTIKIYLKLSRQLSSDDVQFKRDKPAFLSMAESRGITKQTTPNSRCDYSVPIYLMPRLILRKTNVPCTEQPSEDFVGQ